MINTVDLHTHSVLSKHAYSSITENIDEAIKKNMKVLGVLEHQYDELGVGAHYFGISNLSVIPSHVGDLRILKGVELNILENGYINLDKMNIAKLDYSIASMHRYVYDTSHSSLENTTAYINAVQNDYVKILGHIDRDGFPCDYEEVVKACAKSNTIVELNNSSIDIRDNRRIIDRDLEILSYCIKYSCPIIINSDAHIKYDVGNYLDALKVIDEAKFPYDLVLNFNESLFNQYF